VTAGQRAGVKQRKLQVTRPNTITQHASPARCRPCSYSLYHTTPKIPLYISRSSVLHYVTNLYFYLSFLWVCDACAGCCSGHQRHPSVLRRTCVRVTKLSIYLSVLYARNNDTPKVLTKKRVIQARKRICLAILRRPASG
jgi:hypothetical protein